MVTFVSLFLWLVTGVQTIEVAVDSQVHHVQLVLDGEPVAMIEGDRRRATVDFGPLLEPHELVAIAYNDQGVEMGRAAQVVNLPRPEAEAQIVLDHDDEGRARSFRVVTQSSDRVEPVNVVATFDGLVLERDGQGLFTIPEHDPSTIHLISAEANFANGNVARTDLSLGGNFGQIVASELTAVPVHTSGEPPTTEALEGRLTVNGEALRVVAVEHSGARIYVVRDLAASQTLRAAGKSHSRPFRAVRTKRDPVIEYDLDPGIDRVHLVGANAVATRRISLFPVSGAVSLKRWDLPWAVTSLFDREATAEGQRLADAVAIAAIRAAGHGSPRAVVLILSENPDDSSSYSTSAVRHYLDELRVPLVVWVTGKETATSWGAATKTTNSLDLSRASKALLRELDRQWIVWVEGLHLINHIELDGAGLGIELTGRGSHPPELVAFSSSRLPPRSHQPSEVLPTSTTSGRGPDSRELIASN